MLIAAPIVGHWYRRPNGALFEVVALDDDADTVELQFFDGTIDEVDTDVWPSLFAETVRAPEDWLGAVDMDPENFTSNDDGIPYGWHDPLEMLEKAEKGSSH